MDEYQARLVWNDPSSATHAACAEADRWIKEHAMRKLRLRMHSNHVPKAIREYVFSCASAHWGSVETDTMCKALDCYPDWMR